MNERMVHQTQVAGLKRLLEDAAHLRADATMTPPNTPPYLAYRLLYQLQRTVLSGYVTMAPEATSVRYTWHRVVYGRAPQLDRGDARDYLFPIALMERLAPEHSPEMLAGKIVEHWLRQIAKESQP